MKLLKNHLNTVFVFIKFSKYFREYIRMVNQDYKNRNIEKKYLENVRNKQFWKVTNSLFELEKDFIGLNGRALKDRKNIKEG